MLNRLEVFARSCYEGVTAAVQPETAKVRFELDSRADSPAALPLMSLRRVSVSLLVPVPVPVLVR